MVITINKPILFYWAFALIFEIIYTYFQYKNFKKKIRNNPYYPFFQNMYNSSSSVKLLLSNLYHPVTIVGGFVTMAIISPFVFPFSLIDFIKDIVGYKSKLEKASDAEVERMEAAKKASEDFMKTEGVFSPNEELHGHHELDIEFVKKQGGIPDDLQGGD